MILLLYYVFKVIKKFNRTMFILSKLDNIKLLLHLLTIYKTIHTKTISI